MREIKYRYRHKSTKSDFVAVDIVTIEDLYRGNYMAGLSDRNHWELLSRDEYTGLKDKNGQEIFEGDILVEWEDDMEKIEKYVVEWCGDDGYPAFDLKPNHFEESNALSFYANNGEGYEIEVIGNIYENPELVPK